MCTSPKDLRRREFQKQASRQVARRKTSARSHVRCRRLKKNQIKLSFEFEHEASIGGLTVLDPLDGYEFDFPIVEGSQNPHDGLVEESKGEEAISNEK